MNHIYRLVWSSLRNAWVVAHERATAHGKSSITRRMGRSAAVLLTAVIGTQTGLTAYANPLGPSVASGQASFASTGNTLTVTNTPGAIINWQAFSIGANETTRFVQQSAASTVLNRVTGGVSSSILGTLQSNGRVFLVNPNGIVFGAGATVDVAGLVATTLNLSDADFLSGRYNFTQVPGAQNISNAGNLAAQQGGQIYLIAPNVENTGIITAPNGEILLAAGHEVELVNSLDPNLRVNITAPAGDATNVGQLVAEAGSLGLFGTVVKNSGTVSADSAVMQGGKIVFRASQRVEAGGIVSAQGKDGGEIKVLGHDVQIGAGAMLDASGASGGGTILVGGDAYGANPAVQNAQTAYVDADATVKADATQNGDGGKIVVWADNTARAYGNFSARGGAYGGNGGFIETSGHYLDVAGIRIDTAALNGQAGTWLLDPWNVTIASTADAAGTFAGGIWTPSATGSTITAATIVAALDAGTSVTINTSGGGGGEAGNITVSAAISSAVAGVGTTLTLNADNNIAINQSITSTGNALNLVLNHGAAGAVTLANALSLAGGNVDVQNAGVTGAGTLNVTGGTTTLTGTLSAATLGISAGTLNLSGATPTTITTLNMSGGTINDTVGMTLNGGINWSGTAGKITGAGILTTAVGSTSAISGTATLTDKTWSNSGTLTLSGTGALVVGGTGATATTFNNEASGIINLTGTSATPINRTAGTSIFNNAGTINKTTATNQTFNTNVAFNNTGTVNVNAASGSLAIAGGGVDTGNYNIAAGNTLNFSGGTRTFDLASIISNSGTLGFTGATASLNGGYSGTGALTISAGTFNYNSTSVIDPATILTMSGGTFNYNSTGNILTLANPVNFSGGTINDAVGMTLNGGINWSGTTGKIAGAGILTTATGSSSAISGTATLTDKTWNNVGTITLSSTGSLVVGGLGATATTFNNEATGILNLSGTGATPINRTAGTSIFNNAGTINKTTATNQTFNTNVTFNNTGTLNVNAASGSLAIAGGGVDTGNYNIAAGNTLNFSGGTRTLDVGSTVTGTGTLQVGGATVNLNTGAPFSPSNLTLSSGTLTGADALSTSGIFTWSGGTYSGTGGLTTTGAATTTISGGAILNAATWNNAGTATISGTGSLTLNNSAVLNNEATGIINLSGTSTTPINRTAGTSAFNNAGTINKTTGTSQTFNTNVAFNNTGTVNVNAASGSLLIAGGGIDTGDYTIAAGNTLNFKGGTRTLDAGSTVTGAGTLQVGGATVNANVALGIANTGTGITVSAGTLNANAGSLSGALVPVTVSGTGTLNLNSGAPLTLGNLTFSAGNLNGADALTVNNFAWSGGNYSGTGGLTTTGTSTISGAANMYGATWNQSGTLTFSGSGALNINTGSVLNNEATGIINLTGTSFGPISYSTGSIGASIFNNAGTVNKTTATGHTWHAYLTFNNTGTVNADSGTLIISSSGADTGDYNVASGATLLFQYTRTFDAGANIAGLGTLKLNGTINANGSFGIANTGTALVVMGGTLNANAGSLSGTLVPVTIGGGGASPIVNLNTGGTLNFSDLTLASNGTLRGSDALTVAGTFNWSGGTYSGTGGLTTNGVSTVSSASTLNAATWNQAGTLTISGPGSLTFFHGAILNNEATGTIDLTGSSIDPFYCYIDCHINSFFNNAGTFNKASGSSATQTLAAAVTLTNTGTVNVDSGTLAIGGTLNQTGVINVASGATLTKTSVFTNAGTLAGAGTINVGANTLINNGTIAPGSASGDTTGTLTINGNLSLGSGGNLAVDAGGTVSGSYDTLAVTGNVTLGGTLNAAFVDGYTPVNADYLPFMTMGGKSSGVFSAVNTPGSFLYAGYGLAAGEAARLIYIDGAGATVFTNVAGGLTWENPANWSGGVLPGAVDDVLISAGHAVVHGAGNDTIASLTINSGNSLDITGGSLTVMGASYASGAVTIVGGTLAANGPAYFANLGLSAGAVLDAQGTLSLYNYTMGAGARIDIAQSGTGILSIAGQPYTVINSLGAEGSMTALDLQGMNGNLAGNYALGSDIDASATSAWNAGAGFVPVGNFTTSFTGNFDGLGHAIANLAINRPAEPYIGLFGITGAGSTIANIGLAGGSVSGVDSTGALVGRNHGDIINSYASATVMAGDGSGYDFGGLVGRNWGGSITDSHATGNVIGGIWSRTLGGLVGDNLGGTIANSFATGSVSTGSYNFNLGGLVGDNSGAIANSYATGSLSGVNCGNMGGLAGLNEGSIVVSYATGNVNGVDGSYYLGGLVGWNYAGGTIANSYATGGVSGGVSSHRVGGLVGLNDAAIDNSYASGSVSGSSAVGGLVGDNFGATASTYWDTETSGMLTGVGAGSATGATGLTTAQMKNSANFAGWDIASTGGAGTVWRIYEGQTAPLLSSFLTPLTVTANAATKTYDGIAYIGGNGVTYSIAAPAVLGTPTYGGASQGAVNAGSYVITASGLYSGQQGYDISYADGTLTISPALILASVKASDASKTYGNTLTFAGTEFTPTGLVNGDTISGVTLSSSGAINTAAAGTYAITASNPVFSVGSASNYSLSFVDGVLTVNPAPLTITAAAASKVYGNLDPALAYTASGLLFTDTLSGALGRAAGENAGTYAIDQGTLANPNYTISYTGNNLSITPAALTVTADALSKLEGGVDPLLTYTVAGLQFSDTAATTLGGALSRVAGETAGTYPIGIGTLALLNSNYGMSYMPANFTVAAPVLAAPTVVANMASEISGATTAVIAISQAPADSVVGDGQKNDAQQDVAAAEAATKIAEAPPLPLPVCQ